MKRKVLILLPTINSGGAERITLNIAGLASSKHNITVGIFDDSDALDDYIPKAVDVRRLKIKRALFSFRKLYKFINNLQPEIIFSSHSRVTFILSILKLFLKFKLISRMQGTPSLEIGKEYSLLRVKVYAFGYRRSDKVIAQTEDMVEDAKNIYGVHEDKVEIFQNPINTEHIDKSINQLNPFISFKNNFNIVLSGRLVLGKGFDLLIKSLKNVNIKNYMVHILGDDRGEKRNLENLLKERNLTDKVIFYGNVKNPYIYYVNCDLYVQSSRWEGCPNAFLENVYLGTPIVASECIPIIKRISTLRKNIITYPVYNIDMLSHSLNESVNLTRCDIGFKQTSNIGDIFDE
tara:strand:+ start:128 stop:1171 length:1044 start_codon:yes stop_codon:yes gene_type:complete